MAKLWTVGIGLVVLTAGCGSDGGSEAAPSPAASASSPSPSGVATPPVMTTPTIATRPTTRSGSATPTVIVPKALDREEDATVLLEQAPRKGSRGYNGIPVQAGRPLLMGVSCLGGGSLKVEVSLGAKFEVPCEAGESPVVNSDESLTDQKIHVTVTVASGDPTWRLLFQQPR